MLYRAVNIKCYPWDATRQARRCTLCSTRCGQQVPDFRPAWPTTGLFIFASRSRNVWTVKTPCNPLSFATRARKRARLKLRYCVLMLFGRKSIHRDTSAKQFSATSPGPDPVASFDRFPVLRQKGAKLSQTHFNERNDQEDLFFLPANGLYADWDSARGCVRLPDEFADASAFAQIKLLGDWQREMAAQQAAAILALFGHVEAAMGNLSRAEKIAQFRVICADEGVDCAESITALLAAESAPRS